MKGIIYIALMGICFALFACQSDGSLVADGADSRIYLTAEVEHALVQSRTPYWLSEPTADNPLLVDVWAATTTPPDYIFEDIGKDGTDGVVALHTQAHFTNGKAQLLNDAVYPKTDGTKVYFVGMHPRGWTTTDGKLATYTFDGSDDVMFAPHISGQYAENVDSENWPKFKFKHLLTWLRIEFVADNEAVSTAWGKVKNITIKSKKTVEVNLNQEYPSEKKHNEQGASINFKTESDLAFYQTGTDNKFPSSEGYEVPGPLAGTGLSSYIQEKAYVLCEPVYATDEENEYTVTITTEKRTVNVGIDLMKDAATKFTGTTMGYQFTVLLHFKMGGKISVSAVATDWVNGGMGTADVGSGNITTTNN